MQKLLNNLERDIYHSSKNDQLMIVKNFLSEIDFSLVKLFINKAKEKDAFSLAFKVILSPPHIVPLATFHGFSVEIIHWLYSDDIEMRTDNEDIHDHFGIIMSKALIGNPYLNISYEVNNSGNLEKIGEFLFRENNIILINPNDIHQVIMQPKQSALSIRVVFPEDKQFCHVYNADGRIERRIENSMRIRSRVIDAITVL